MHRKKQMKIIKTVWTARGMEREGEKQRVE